MSTDVWVYVGTIASVIQAGVAILMYFKWQPEKMDSQFLISIILILALAAFSWVALFSTYKATKGDTTSISQSNQTVEFYENRTEMAQEGKGIGDEIQNTSRVWVAMIAGAVIPTMPDDLIKRIDRLILIDPQSDSMQILSRIQLERGPRFPAYIKETLEKCRKLNVNVRLSKDPVLNVVIGDPDTPQAWARIQLLIPHVLGQDSPSIKITKENHPRLFETIKNSFLKTWEKSRNPV